MGLWTLVAESSFVGRPCAVTGVSRRRRRERRRRVYPGGRAGETSDHHPLPGEKKGGMALTN